MSKTYFDNSDKQYQEKLILSPPVHTKMEIEILISKLDKTVKELTDFGSGTGRLTIPLLKKHYKVTAVDISQNSLNRLKLMANNKELKTSLKITKSESVVGCDVLHHINIDKYFKIFYEKLKNGGQIIFSEPNGWNIFWYLLIYFKLNWQEEKGITKINYFNIINKLKKSGFNNIEITGLGILPGPFCMNSNFLCKLNYWLGNLPIIKLFSYRLLIGARKN